MKTSIYFLPTSRLLYFHYFGFRNHSLNQPTVAHKQAETQQGVNLFPRQAPLTLSDFTSLQKSTRQGKLKLTIFLYSFTSRHRDQPQSSNLQSDKKMQETMDLF